MRNFTILLVAFLMGGCSSSPTPRTESSSVETTQMAPHGPETPSMDSVQQFLLAAAASDFPKHGPSRVVRFRDVHFRYLVSPAGERTYLMCGQFLSEMEGSKTAWTPFVTIKTDPYEQWIGGQAATFCGGSSPALGRLDDLSSQLQSRFDSLK